MDAGLAVDLAWMLHEWNETINEYDEFKVRLTHPGLARLASVSTQGPQRLLLYYARVGIDVHLQ